MESTVYGTLFVILGLLSIGYAAHAYHRASRARSWPRAEGSIVQVSIKFDKRTVGEAGEQSRDWYLPDIQYTYRVGGRSFAGNRIVIGELQSMPHENALEMVKPYRDGMKVRVYVDPSDPAYAVLEARTDLSSTFLYGSIGAALLFVVYYARYHWGR